MTQATTQGCPCSCHNPVMSGLFCKHCTPDGRPGYKPQGEEELPDYYIKTIGADGMTITVEGKEAFDFFIKAVVEEELTKARLEELNALSFNWGSLLVAGPRRYIEERKSALTTQLNKERRVI